MQIILNMANVHPQSITKRNLNRDHCFIGNTLHVHNTVPEAYTKPQDNNKIKTHTKLSGHDRLLKIISMQTAGNNLPSNFSIQKSSILSPQRLLWIRRTITRIWLQIRHFQKLYLHLICLYCYSKCSYSSLYVRTTVNRSQNISLVVKRFTV